MNDATKIVREDEMMDLESVFNEIKAMSQEQFDALMEEVRAMSEPPYDLWVWLMGGAGERLEEGRSGGFLPPSLRRGFVWE